ncbi:MAG: hypothetical protein C5B49_06735, partial [Bdellovibrio sp.]
TSNSGRDLNPKTAKGFKILGVKFAEENFGQLDNNGVWSAQLEDVSMDEAKAIFRAKRKNATEKWRLTPSAKRDYSTVSKELKEIAAEENALFSGAPAEVAQKLKRTKVTVTMEDIRRHSAFSDMVMKRLKKAPDLKVLVQYFRDLHQMKAATALQLNLLHARFKSVVKSPRLWIALGLAGAGYLYFSDEVEAEQGSYIAPRHSLDEFDSGSGRTKHAGATTGQE